jgi:glycosyltransferase involved in cell wall biosynthesis
VRVLIVHNRYRSAMPSGENRVVDADVSMLRTAGIEVETFFRESDSIAELGAARTVALAASPTYSIEAVRAFRRTLRRFRPELVHLHNPFPLISPWVVRIAEQERIPIVQTVHNYRHSCPGSTGLLRDGRICEDCVGRSFPWPGVLHGCYHGSRAQSLSRAVATRVHRSTWQQVDRFLAVSDFVAGYLALAGIAPDRIVIHPNATRSLGPSTPPGSGFLFVGRLTSEKGVSLLMSAWDRLEGRDSQELVVAGDGPERDKVIAARRNNVRYEGLVGQQRARELIEEAAIVVVPSLCFEAFSLVVAEAFERGRPVASTAMGALGALVTPDVGWTAEANPDAFAAMLSRAATDPKLCDKAAAARAFFESHLTQDVSVQRLLGIYTDVLEKGTREVSPRRLPADL